MIKMVNNNGKKGEISTMRISIQVKVLRYK